MTLSNMQTAKIKTGKEDREPKIANEKLRTTSGTNKLTQNRNLL